VLGSVGEKAVPPVPEPDDVAVIEDRWILSRLAGASTEITRGIEEFTFQNSVGAAYTFAWNEFCDWWLEAAKDRLREGDPAALGIAVFCLDNLFRLLHPFMPFVTEELWSRMPGHGDFLMRTRWPADLTRYGDGQAEFEFESLMQAVEEIRSYRKTVPGAPMKGGAVSLSEPAEPDWVRVLSVLGNVAVVDQLPPGKAYGLTEGSIVFPTAAVADPAVIARKRANLQKELDRVQDKLDNPEFRAKAPEAVILEQETRADELRAAIERLE
jgi:valyl-tRNA synthetase